MPRIAQHNMQNYFAFNLFIFFVLLYLLSTSGLNYYHTDASLLRLEVVKSLFENGELAIPDGMGLRGTDGRDYSWLGIGSVLISIPFYMLGKVTGIDPSKPLLILNQLFSAGTATLIYIFSSRLGYSKRASLLASVFYGLCTYAWPEAKHPFDHPVETFFILLTVYYFYMSITRNKNSYLCLSAFFLGMAFLTRQTSLLVVPALLVLSVRHCARSSMAAVSLVFGKKFLLFLLVYLPFLSISLWYNYYRFGSIMETGYSLMASRLSLDFFTGTSLWSGLCGFIISPGKGFFYYSPVALLIFVSFIPFYRRNRDIALGFACIIILYLVFLSKNIYWHGDWAWGPRYLLVITPYMIIPLAELFDSTWHSSRWVRNCVYLLFSISLLIQIAAVSVDYNKYFVYIKEDRVGFTTVTGIGVQPINEPESSNYWSWKNSPILLQFKFIYDFALNINNYVYEMPDNSHFYEQRNLHPSMNVYDFWWLYIFINNRDYFVFVVPLILILLLILSAFRIKSSL